MIIKSRILLLLILLGLAIRLILITLPGFKFDIDAWYAWAIRLNQVGLSHFYSEQVWTNYTPGYLYILQLLGFIKNLLNISDSLFYSLLKLPSIIAEILLGIVVYYAISKKSNFWATIASASILFNPVFIFNSSVWGQIDGLLSLVMIISIFFLYEKRLLLSSIFLGLSFLIKPQAIALVPIFGLYILKNFSIKNLLQIILPGFLTIFLLSIPFFTNQPLGIVKLFTKMVSDYSYTSLFAYNFWGSVGFWIDDKVIWNSLSYQQWGQILYISYWIVIAFFYLKGKLSLYSISLLATLGFFFLPTRVHERYLYPALVFLIINMVIYKSRLLFLLTSILTFIHTLNLYYVYVYYNELHLKLPKLLYIPFLYNLLDINSKILSLASSLLFILITIVIIKYSYDSKKALL